MKLKLPSILIIGLMFFSCSNPPEKLPTQQVTPDHEEYIPIILDFLKSHLLDKDFVTNNCFNINPELMINTMSCSYASWNKVYYHTFVAEGAQKNRVYSLSESSLDRAIDFDTIKKMKKTKTDISTTFPKQSLCINWVKDSNTLKTATFSPLIPSKAMAKWEVWMTMTAEEGNPEYKFAFKKVDGKLVILNHTYGVTCNSKLVDELGDHIK